MSKMEEDSTPSMKIEISEYKDSENEESPKLFNKFKTILDSLNNYKSDINNLIQEVKALEKETQKELKSMKKEINKRKINKKPSGFATPSRISNELCDFMNIDQGSKRARTEVTQYLIQYINDKNLQNENNKRIINPDQKLKSLLDVQENEQVDYFNIQKFMNKHFSKE